MDIARGSRRARHVAANTQSQGQAQQSPQTQITPQQHPPAPHHNRQQATGAGGGIGGNSLQLNTPPAVHRTPDQSNDADEAPAPPPNPFRLHRYQPQVCEITYNSMLCHDSLSWTILYREKRETTRPKHHTHFYCCIYPARYERAMSAPRTPHLGILRDQLADIADTLGIECKWPAPRSSGRVPLQELSISHHGNNGKRNVPVMRPIPVEGKENNDAIDLAYEELQDYTDALLQELDQAFYVFEALKADIGRRESQLQEILSRNRLAISRSNETPATLISPQARLSMSMNSDDSGSEPDLSVLAMARPGNGHDRQITSLGYEDETLSQQDQYEGEDTSIAEDERMEPDDEVAGLDPSPIGLKEISNLGKFTVSSHKPGNGVEALRSDDLKQFWQSDGPQPHRLTVYFVKRVGIRDIRFYVDYQEDESYTPTKIVFRSGTSENNLIEFATMNLDNPRGWQQVPIAGAGGDPDGNTLVSYVLQMQILENHQNGKDTHLRGIKIYAFDPDHGAGHMGNPMEDVTTLLDRAIGLETEESSSRRGATDGGFSIPYFMREPEIR